MPRLPKGAVAKSGPIFKKKQAMKKNYSLVAPPTMSRRGEKKNLDFTVANTIVAAQTTAVVALLNAALQGTTPQTYIGRSIRMTSIHIRWLGGFVATTAGASPLRMLVVYDKQTNAATPATTAVVVADAISNPMNLANNRRFVILMDEEVETVGTGGPQCWFVNRYRKLNLVTEFNTTNGGTVADITTGGIFVFFWQNGNIVTANPSSVIYSRIRFVDE